MKIAEDLRRAVLQAGIEGRLTGGRCEGWRFVRLGDISLSIQYGYNAPAREKGSVKMVRISDIQNNNIQWDNVPYCEIFESDIQKYLLAKNDILFARTGGTVGKSYLVANMPEKAIYAGYLIRMRLDDEVNPQYVKYFMESESYWKQLRNGTTATAQPNCNGKTLSQMIIPLPPIEEQHRIVSRLDSILPLIAELETAENELEAIERRFPGDMRDSLLQAAIEGKLTGGTEGWRWVRLGDVISLISGTDLPSDQHNTVGNGTPYITGASNIVNGSLIINRWTTTPKKIAKRGDILLTCKGTIGANCVLELEEAHIARQIMAIRVTGADMKFVHYYIQHYVDTLKNQAKSMIPGIERKNITEALIPLPPLDQQHKIVSRLNELLPLCEALEKIT